MGKPTARPHIGKHFLLTLRIDPRVRLSSSIRTSAQSFFKWGCHTSTATNPVPTFRVYLPKQWRITLRRVRRSSTTCRPLLVYHLRSHPPFHPSQICSSSL